MQINVEDIFFSFNLVACRCKFDIKKIDPRRKDYSKILKIADYNPLLQRIVEKNVLVLYVYKHVYFINNL